MIDCFLRDAFWVSYTLVYLKLLDRVVRGDSFLTGVEHCISSICDSIIYEVYNQI